MFIGHLGAALALKKIDRQTNLGWFMASVMFLDFLLWLFVILKIESVIIPENYSEMHYLFFRFQYSHSLMASLCWSALVFILVRMFSKSSLTAGAMALGVFSHFILDFIAHPPQIPLMGEDSMRVGLSLWNNMPLELSLEFIILALGMYAYLSLTTAATAGGKYGLVVLMSLLTISAFMGQLLGPPPQSIMQIAFSSLFIIVITVLLASYFDKKRISKPI